MIAGFGFGGWGLVSPDEDPAKRLPGCSVPIPGRMAPGVGGSALEGPGILLLQPLCLHMSSHWLPLAHPGPDGPTEKVLCLDSPLMGRRGGAAGLDPLGEAGRPCGQRPAC